jgi:sulfur carrier protein
LDVPWDGRDGVNGKEGVMQILVNGEQRDVAADANVLQLIESLALAPKTVVVQRNGEIVPREAFGATPLMDGDNLELIRFVGGG